MLKETGGIIGGILLVLAAFFFSGCGRSENGSDGERIVTLGASPTEIVYALGAGDSLVASDSSSRFPAEARSLPKVGYFRSISAEGVLGMRPTLVIAAHGAGPEHAMEQLELLDEKFLRMHETVSIEALEESIEEIGVALGRESAAKKLIRDLRRQLAEVEEKREKIDEVPRVLFLMNTGESGGLNAAGKNTAANEVIELAGGKNVLNDFEGYRTVSAEALVERQPDVILYSSGYDGSPGEIGARLNESWARSTPAGRNGRTYPIDISYYLVLGPRIGNALQDLMILLHD